MTTNTLSKYYRKINSVYQRDKKGVFIPEFADPDFEEHLDLPWDWYFKWDGTSVGFEVGGDPFGRTESSALSWEQWRTVLDWQTFEERHGYYVPDYYVYGELIGPGIQGNPHQLERLDVVTFAYDTDPHPANRLCTKTLREAIEDFRVNGGDSFTRPKGYFEGVVGYLSTDPRIVTKLKVKDRWSW